MFKIFGEYYYVDLDMIEKYTSIDDEEQPKIEEGDDIEQSLGENQTKIHLIKYEMVKYLLEVVMDPQDEIDEKLAGSTNELSIPFKMAFNSLLTKNIINKL